MCWYYRRASKNRKICIGWRTWDREEQRDGNA
jgi:hypothetical protein